MIYDPLGRLTFCCEDCKHCQIHYIKEDNGDYCQVDYGRCLRETGFPRYGSNDICDRFEEVDTMQRAQFAFGTVALD